MLITEKLNLQTELGGLVLFREGLFLRAYNESAYILTQLMRQRLTVRTHRIKKYKLVVVDCAFPVSQLNRRLPHKIMTDFGVHLDYICDLSGYGDWFLHRCHKANIVGEVATTRDEKRLADE